MKLDRLISILVILLRKERVQAKELAERFGVSVRTILRDVDAINLAGIPIVTYQGVNGGIGIAEGYRLDKSVLTENEMAALITTLKGIGGSIPDNNNDMLMEKFKNTLSVQQLDRVNTKASQLIIDLVPWGGNESIRGKLGEIRQAIETKKKIEFEYLDSSGNKTIRIVEPYSLILKGQNWYMYAWCHVREDFRFFKLSRIRGMSITEVVFIPREAFVEEHPWENEWQKPDKFITLELMFEDELRNIAEEWFGESIYFNPDGRIMAEIKLPENNWLYGFLLSFGSGIEVINPPHIREMLGKKAKEIVEKYLNKYDRQLSCLECYNVEKAKGGNKNEL
ncbi:MAG: YobV [Clostridiales bacterium]|nr:YobV [Clostridiales bacterium]